MYTFHKTTNVNIIECNVSDLYTLSTLVKQYNGRNHCNGLQCYMEALYEAANDLLPTDDAHFVLTDSEYQLLHLALNAAIETGKQAQLIQAALDIA